MYPNEADPEFQRKISKMLEFSILDNVEGLYPHQEFVRRFMAPYTPYTSVMLNHELGSGKSIACISTAVDHFLANDKTCLVVTRGETNSESFMEQIEKYVSMMPESSRIPSSSIPKIFTIVHYTSFCNIMRPLSDDNIRRRYSNSVMIFDEFHNVKRTGADHTKSDDGFYIYKSIERLIKLTQNIKFFIVTATPMTDNINQLNPILDLLWAKDVNVPLNKALGKISYTSVVIEGPKKVMMSENDECGSVVRSFMSGHQLACYLREGREVVTDIYHGLSQIALFVFDNGAYGKEIFSRKVARISRISLLGREVHAYSRYEIKEEYKHCLIGEGLKNSSCKYYRLMKALKERPGKTFVFVEDVMGSGALLLDCIMREHGYELYNGQNLSRLKKGLRFSICVGDRTYCPNLIQRLAGFNDPRNKNGEYVKVIIGSRVIGESVSMTCVKEFHFMSPHWNSSMFRQAEGRVFRSGSHDDLSPEERFVNVWIHLASLPSDESYSVPDPEEFSESILSVDDRKISVSVEKHAKISDLESAIYGAAIDRFVRPIQNDELIPADADIESFVHKYSQKVSDAFLDPIMLLFVENCRDYSGEECRMWFSVSQVVSYTASYFDQCGMRKFTDLRFIAAVLSKLCVSQTDVLGPDNLGCPYFLRSFTASDEIIGSGEKTFVYLTNDISVNGSAGSVHASICGRLFVPGYGEVGYGKQFIRDIKIAGEHHENILQSLSARTRTPNEYILYCIKSLTSPDIMAITSLLEENILAFLNGSELYDGTFLSMLRTLYILEKKAKISYHITLCKYSDSFYAASKAGVKSTDRIRKLCNGEWKNVSNLSTRLANTIFERKINAKRKDLSNKHVVYGYIPLSSGSMRLCSSLFTAAKTENTKRGDKRLFRRGKNIFSFLKEHIVSIYIYIKYESSDIAQIAKYMVSAMDEVLVRRSSARLDDEEVINLTLHWLFSETKDILATELNLCKYYEIVKETRIKTSRDLSETIIEHLVSNGAYMIA